MAKRSKGFLIGVLLLPILGAGIWIWLANKLHLSVLPHESRNVSRSQDLCALDCTSGSPCEYPYEVDIRIIVMTFDRSESLKKCLSHVWNLDTLGDKMSVDIWIDPDKDTRRPDSQTLKVARQFVGNVSTRADKDRFQACVHVQDSHVGIYGQWVHTWRPRADGREIGLLLEDDIDISPHAYRWLRDVSRYHGNRTDVSGYSIQSENLRFAGGKRLPMKAPPTERVFLYGILGTWGFAPHPDRWRHFQDWVTVARSGNDVKPYVPDIVNTVWYKKFEKKGTEESMWTMWHIYYSYIHDVYCLYNNLEALTGRKDALLCTNRREPGLHFSDGGQTRHQDRLLRTWDQNFTRFRRHPLIRFSSDGSLRKW